MHLWLFCLFLVEINMRKSRECPRRCSSWLERLVCCVLLLSIPAAAQRPGEKSCWVLWYLRCVFINNIICSRVCIHKMTPKWLKCLLVLAAVIYKSFVLVNADQFELCHYFLAPLKVSCCTIHSHSCTHGALICLNMTHLLKFACPLLCSGDSPAAFLCKCTHLIAFCCKALVTFLRFGDKIQLFGGEGSAGLKVHHLLTTFLSFVSASNPDNCGLQRLRLTFRPPRALN